MTGRLTRTEQMAYRPDGPYGMSKAVGELLLRYAADRYGFAGVALRIRAFRGRPSFARETRLWISPGDIVRLVRAALTRAQPEFNTTAEGIPGVKLPGARRARLCPPGRARPRE
jgi:nucleoside-diphosphate-sugar epimerase